MKRALRRAVFAVPFGCLTAIVAHAVRFGDDHAFGGDANEPLVAAAVAASGVVGLAILHAFLTAGSTTVTGTIAAARARELIPNGATIFTFAAAIYYGIETLEGNGLEIGVPTLLLALSAVALAALLRGGITRLAGIVADLMRVWLALLTRRACPIRYRSVYARPMHSQVAYATRRLGRAPPDGRRSP